MDTCEKMIRSIRDGSHDRILSELYALDGTQESLSHAKLRAIRVLQEFQNCFPASSGAKAALFSGPARTELGGNHTDHQHGRVLCGSVDLDMLACAAPNELNEIRIFSEGYPELRVALSDLSPKEEEQNTSAGLVRGVAAKIAEMGQALVGFDAYITSDILVGSGVSSSAAYEVLVVNILNHFCGCDLDPVQIAKIGQHAENVFFGKPCGLMDQMASSVGGAIAIDFSDRATPQVKKIDYDFTQCGHALCIVDTGSCHADLTDDYAGITMEMGSVAAYFGKSVLREVPEQEFLASIPSLRVCCGDRAVLRAIHYYEDDRRAVEEAQALEAGDFHRFLNLVNQSGISSATNLQNIWSVNDPRQQAVSLALALSKRTLNGTGAFRVHGGGFAGTIQAFVPSEKLSSFKRDMEAVFGPGSCHILHIRSKGGCVVIG